MEENTIAYVAIIMALAVLGWTAYGAFATPATPVQQVVPSECGDITDNSNVQHLSHHPDRYAECIKLVDPAKFKEAVGTDKSTYMQQNGIQ